MFRSAAVALVVYLGLALFMLYPAWTSPAHGVVGDWTHPDCLGNHWLYHWTAEQLSAGAGILHNDRYYAPVGDAPFLAGNGSDAVYATLLGSWVDWPFSVTLWCLLTLVLNGVASAALAGAAGAGTAGRLVAGSFLVMCPYVVREMSAGRFAQAGLFTSAFFLASWLRLLAAPTTRGAFWAALWFSLAAFQYWYYGLWMALSGAIFWAFRPSVAALSRFVPLALLGTLPPLWLFLSNWQAIPGTEEASFPHPITVDYGLFGGFFLWSGTGELGSIGLPVFLSVLAVAGFAVADRTWRGAAVVAALVFYALALGPEILGPDGSGTGLPGPFVLVYRWTTVLQRFWWPYRHIAPLVLVLVPLAALGADRVIRWLDLRGATALVIALLPIELYARGAVLEVAVSYFTPPPAYQALATRAPATLLELPIYEKLARNESSVSYQMVHGLRLLNGHAMWVDRVRPAAWDEFVAAQPLLAALRAFEAGELKGDWSLDGRAPWTAGSLDYISLSREYYPGDLRDLRAHEEAFLRAWFGEPVVKEGGVKAWDVRGAPVATRYTWPDWTAPGDYVEASGLAALPDSVRAAGWLNWARAVPPEAPEWAPDTEYKELRDARLPPALKRRLGREEEIRDTGVVP